MNKLSLVLFVLLAGCSTPSHSNFSLKVPESALHLDTALEQKDEETLSYLKSRVTAKSYEGLTGNDPAAQIPENLKMAKVKEDTSLKAEQRQFLKKFRAWKFSKKDIRATELLADFKCESAVETQTLGYSMELDFPLEKAVSNALALHEKVLTCPDIAKNESYFRLAVFSIQQGNCDKGMAYLKSFPGEEQKGSNDRVTYIRSLCSAESAQTMKSANPWSGYGILLKEYKPMEKAHELWYLSTESGDPEWDRILASLLELSEAGRNGSVAYISTKLDYEKFRKLPLQFQVTMMYLMHKSGADLTIFQTLHRYLAENPEMITPVATRLLFPTRYWSEILEFSRDADPVLVKALIRQESAFNPNARSRAKASGLMQLIYPTARIFGIKKPQQLLLPEKNIETGSKFLAQLIRQFGSVELALAAYNAGPAMVKQWQKRYPTENVDLFVEMIPYSETREYVRLVTRNYKIYQSLLPPPTFASEMLKSGMR